MADKYDITFDDEPSSPSAKPDKYDITFDDAPAIPAPGGDVTPPAPAAKPPAEQSPGFLDHVKGAFVGAIEGSPLGGVAKRVGAGLMALDNAMYSDKSIGEEYDALMAQTDKDREEAATKTPETYAAGKSGSGVASAYMFGPAAFAGLSGANAALETKGDALDKLNAGIDSAAVSFALGKVGQGIPGAGKLGEMAKAVPGLSRVADPIGKYLSTASPKTVAAVGAGMGARTFLDPTVAKGDQYAALFDAIGPVAAAGASRGSRRARGFAEDAARATEDTQSLARQALAKQRVQDAVARESSVGMSDEQAMAKALGKYAQVHGEAQTRSGKLLDAAEKGVIERDPLHENVYSESSKALAENTPEAISEFQRISELGKDEWLRLEVARIKAEEAAARANQPPPTTERIKHIAESLTPEEVSAEAERMISAGGENVRQGLVRQDRDAEGRTFAKQHAVDARKAMMDRLASGGKHGGTAALLGGLAGGPGLATAAGLGGAAYGLATAHPSSSQGLGPYLRVRHGNATTNQTSRFSRPAEAAAIYRDLASDAGRRSLSVENATRLSNAAAVNAAMSNPQFIEALRRYLFERQEAKP